MSATLLGWHAEGPFIQFAKRGAHEPQFLLSAKEEIKSFEEVYGANNLAVTEDWLMGGETHDESVGVRVITAAPEVDGVMASIEELVRRGVVFSIGHSIASTGLATAAVQGGARLITHLFNAMPQLHHRDPSIIGLLGASPHLSSPSSPPTSPTSPAFKVSSLHRIPSVAKRAAAAQGPQATSEAFDDVQTPPQTPVLRAQTDLEELHLTKGKVADLSFERPFYEMIVDGIHSHPNSVRVSRYLFYCFRLRHP